MVATRLPQVFLLVVLLLLSHTVRVPSLLRYVVSVI